jgi:hypothetical protein
MRMIQLQWPSVHSVKAWQSSWLASVRLPPQLVRNGLQCLDGNHGGNGKKSEHPRGICNWSHAWQPLKRSKGVKLNGNLECKIPSDNTHRTVNAASVVAMGGWLLEREAHRAVNAASVLAEVHCVGKGRVGCTAPPLLLVGSLSAVHKLREGVYINSAGQCGGTCEGKRNQYQQRK